MATEGREAPSEPPRSETEKEPTGSFGPGPDDSDFVTHAFQPGDVIVDRYRIERAIGKGGMGVVFAARHLALHEDVALKFVPFVTTKNHVATERLFREARVTAKLKSEHVVRVIDVGTAPPGVPFIVMELLEGEDLRSRLGEGERLPVRKALEYVIGVCEPLAEAHALGVVHRDVKPSNLFLARRKDGRETIKLLDFGVSKLSRPLETPMTELTGTDMVIGSPRYMSPEQLGASGDVDGRSDVWSLAAVLYECLAGHPPFRARTITEYCMVLGNGKLPPALASLRDDVPAAVDAAVGRALAFDREQRTPDVGTFARELAAALPSAHPLRQRWLPSPTGSIPPSAPGASSQPTEIDAAAKPGALAARPRRWIQFGIVAALAGGALLYAASSTRRDAPQPAAAAAANSAATGIATASSASVAPMEPTASNETASATPASPSNVAPLPSAVASVVRPPMRPPVPAARSAPGPALVAPTATLSPAPPPSTTSAAAPTAKKPDPFEDRR